MIEVHIDLQAMDITHMDGFPSGSDHPEDLYNEMLTALWRFEEPTETRRYLLEIGLYLSDNFKVSSWRVVAYLRREEVGRLEYLLPREGVVAPQIENAPRVSRYEREPVI